MLSVACFVSLFVADPDVVVYGGTSGGVIAAVQVARHGKRVVLIEPGRHLGGLSSGGLGATDIGNKAAIGGLARDFYRRVRAHYADPVSWTRENASEFRGRGHRAGEDAAWTFEPKVAARIFRDLARTPGVEVVYGERLDLSDGVVKEGTRITAIRMESGREFRAKVFIDASYEGDLLAKAGVSYHVGREANRDYGETLNGNQAARAKHHQFVENVDPWRKKGDPASGLLPGIEAVGAGVTGAGDHRVQAYCFRLCATDVAENRRPWPKPAHYDPVRYELLLRNLEAGDHRFPWHPVLMPNRKTDSNNNHGFSTDYIGMSWRYPDAGYDERARIVAAHESYQKGLMWTLANHPRVPAKVRAHFNEWGPARDEFVDNDNWPHQLYIREARRMVGPYVMTEHDCRGTRSVEDPVGLAAYTMDSHHVRRYVTAEGFVRNEGDVQVGGFPPYPISFRSIVPKRSQCTNLLVPVCLSATHIAFGSIRMEPVFMVLGQSAATAACQAIDAGVPVQEIDYSRLRVRLLRDGQVLVWKKRPVPGGRPLRSLGGWVVDDRRAEQVGAWTRSTSARGFVASGYLHDGNELQGRKRVVYAFRVPLPARYEVRVSWTPHANRASNAVVLIATADGVVRRVVDQRKQPAIGGLMHSLGTFRFDERPVVTVSNEGADGYVIADCVQLLRGG